MISIKDVCKYSKHNHHMIMADVGGSMKHGCYHCISVVDRRNITEWVDDGQTAVCPKCGVDAILPYSTNFEFLADCCEHWFTGRADTDGQPKVLDTLQKLKRIEQSKTIYNIHYCKAGVGISFYDSEKDGDGPDGWRDGINCEKYYPTFEECIAAEFKVLMDGQEDEALFENDGLTAGNGYVFTEETVTVTEYEKEPILNPMLMEGSIDLRQPVYQYKFVSGNVRSRVEDEINILVDDGWEVDGDFFVHVYGHSAFTSQRMRKVKAVG